MKAQKALTEGESTYRNGGGAMCGGVVNESAWQKDLEENGGYGLMMAFVMPDDKFELYRNETDKKKRQALFDEFARSNI